MMECIALVRKQNARRRATRPIVRCTQDDRMLVGRIIAVTWRWAVTNTPHHERVAASWRKSERKSAEAALKILRRVVRRIDNAQPGMRSQASGEQSSIFDLEWLQDMIAALAKIDTLVKPHEAKQLLDAWETMPVICRSDVELEVSRAGVAGRRDRLLHAAERIDAWLKETTVDRRRRERRLLGAVIMILRDRKLELPAGSIRRDDPGARLVELAQEALGLSVSEFSESTMPAK